MKDTQNYQNHPLNPLYQLLLGIASAEEFKARQAEILDAIRLAARVLNGRAPELCKRAKDSFLKRAGTPSTPTLMAYFVETAIKETLHLTKPARPSAKDATGKNTFASPKLHSNNSLTRIFPMTYSELREYLSAITTISTLGGRNEITIHNPAGGDLIAINSRGNRYTVTQADWNDARLIRSNNPANPWATRLYTGPSSYTSHGLIHAAALLRHLEEETIQDSRHHHALAHREAA